MKISNIPRAFRYILRHLRQADRVEKLFVAGRWFDCVSECNKTIEAGLGDFFVHYYLGLSNFELGFVDESTKNLTEAIDLYGSKTGKNKDGFCLKFAKYKIAANHRKLRQYDLAIEQLNQNIADYPKYIENYQLKASIYVDLDNIEEAIKTVQQALQKHLKNEQMVELRNHLSYSYSLLQSEKRNGG